MKRPLFLLTWLLLATAGAVHAQSDACSGGATAVCNDGTLSYSAHRRGTCSHHGGVARWCSDSVAASPASGTGTTPSRARSYAVADSFTYTPPPRAQAAPVAPAPAATHPTPNTGGEPWLMSLFGITAALGGLWGRKRLS